MRESRWHQARIHGLRGLMVREKTVTPLKLLLPDPGGCPTRRKEGRRVSGAAREDRRAVAGTRGTQASACRKAKAPVTLSQRANPAKWRAGRGAHHLETRMRARRIGISKGYNEGYG